jgi:uncharacterized membrane protein
VVNVSPRAGTWLAIAFTASLAANVFLAGLFVGQRMMKPMPPAAAAALRGPERGERPIPPVVDRVAEVLSPKDRSVFLAVIDKHRAEITTAVSAVREARAKVRELLSADTLDHAATENAMRELRDRQSAFQHALQLAMLEAAEALPPEARREMVSLGRHGGGGRE